MNHKIFVLAFLAISSLSYSAEYESTETESPMDSIFPYRDDNIASIQKAVDSFASLRSAIVRKLPKSKKVEADSMFVLYYKSCIGDLHPRICAHDKLFQLYYQRYEGDTLKMPQSISRIAKLLRKNGIEIDIDGIDSRGIHFSRDHLSKMFCRYVSEDLRMAIIQKEYEDQTPYSYGCSFKVSFTEIGNRVAFWESFLLKYPSSRYSSMAKKWYGIYFRAFTHGSDNNPIILGTNDRNDLLPVYQSYTAKNPGKESTRILMVFVEKKMGNNQNNASPLDSLLVSLCEYMNLKDYE